VLSIDHGISSVEFKLKQTLWKVIAMKFGDLKVDLSTEIFILCIYFVFHICRKYLSEHALTFNFVDEEKKLISNKLFHLQQSGQPTQESELETD
jgi:hypothetical protein